MCNIQKITDLNDKQLELYTKYSEVQLLRINEPAPGVFIAESPKVIERALDAGYEPISILMEEGHQDGEGKDILKRCPEIPVFVGEFDLLTKLTGFQLTRGMLCAMKRKALLDPMDICKGAKRIAVLENVMNPTNVGAIVRSAAALNIDGILFTAGCADPLYRRAVRVSMGNIFQIPWTMLDKESWPEKGIEALRNQGFKTVAMALCDNSVSIDDKILMEQEKLAIILGTEGDGLATHTIADCDFTVKIPMTHGVDSLNVAAASAVAFWQIGRKV